MNKLTKSFRLGTFLAGAGMAFFSWLTVRHFFAANYPETIFEGSICDINAFFNCDSSAFSMISQLWGVPLGYFGLVVGALVWLGAIFPSHEFEDTNRSIVALNGFGVIGLLLFSVFYLGSLCLLCTGYYVFSLISLFLFWRGSGNPGKFSGLRGFLRPSIKHTLTFAVIALVGAYGFALFHDAKKEAQSGGVSARIVQQYKSLPVVGWPSVISPFWTVRSTPEFEDAPIRIVEYADFLCSDCLYLHEQMVRLKQEFAGKLNVAFQFFPLDAKCNSVVEKDKHPGACDLSYMSAFQPEKFQSIHDEIFGDFRAARDPQWRLALARKHGVEEALEDEETREVVHRIIDTGAEYERTSEQFSHGIRSTPTMIINGRMIIGTLPYEHLRAIFQSIVDEHEPEDRKGFIENWVETP